MENYSFEFKKSLGQNFLKEDSIVKKIVSCANIKEKTLVIEIGPGAGALTKVLSKQAQNVLAYEIDSRLEIILDKELLHHENVKIIFDDFLKRNIKKDLENYSYDHLYVVANLPYYITTPIITKLIDEKIDVEKIVVMIQKEVGDRFTAKPGSKDYSSLTVFLNYYFDIKKEFLVSRNNFIPKPNVDSVVVSLTKKENNTTVLDEELFFQLVRNSFRFKRKTLKNNLKGYNLELIEQVLKKKGFDLTVRSEQLPLEVFIEIANHLSKEES